MDEKDILSRISALVDEEHQLRGSSVEHDDDQKARLTHVETQLDQCWDLLRQRRAKRQYGENPEEAEARPASEVEGYLQ